jgi:Transposase DDE domain
LAALTELCLLRSPSFNDLAAAIQSHDGADPSRQAVALRFSKGFELFLQTLLAWVISGKADRGIEDGPADVPGFLNYRRVLVQDSTVIPLPLALFPSFSGVSNGTTSVCNARIQAVYELRSAKLLTFSIDPYRKNDLIAAPELEIGPGDLVLRDRGYLTADEIQRHVATGADVIYRHKTGFTCLDVATQQPVDLLKLLQEHGTLDLEVLLNNPERTRVRLLAAPVSAETANLRRMRAKKETKGHNPSQAVLALMDWTLFITTIAADEAGFEKILRLYGLRWRIEVIFKAWKSHLKFGVMHQVSERQMRTLLYARLLVIAAAFQLYRRIEEVLLTRHGARLSLLKFMNYLAARPVHLLRVIQWMKGGPDDAAATTALIKALARYCCYGKRKTRRNFSEIWDELA